MGPLPRMRMSRSHPPGATVARLPSIKGRAAVAERGGGHPLGEPERALMPCGYLRFLRTPPTSATPVDMLLLIDGRRAVDAAMPDTIVLQASPSLYTLETE